MLKNNLSASGNAESPDMPSDDRAAIYQRHIDLSDKDDERSIIYDYIEKNSVVLDVGCACGDLGVVLKGKKQCRVIGMEYNKQSIEIALANGAYGAIHNIDLNCFDINDFKHYFSEFDHIVFGDVLEHIYYPHVVLEQFKKLLKPTGSFLISFPNIAHASIKTNLLINDWTYTKTGLLDETHIRFFTYKSIAYFLANLELKIIRAQYTSYNRKGMQPNKPWKKLPWPITLFVYSDPHSFVLQYVLQIKSSESSCAGAELQNHNLSRLRIQWPAAAQGIKRNMRGASLFAPFLCGLRALRSKVFRSGAD